jgi:hypothetical protein
MPDAAAAIPGIFVFGRYRSHYAVGRVLNPDSLVAGSKTGREGERN